MRVWKLFLFLLAAWLITGVYVVGGNERAAVRRFGRAVADAEGRLVLKRSGLHFDWPWPLSRVDRFNLNEIRTLNTPASPLQVDDVNQLLGGDYRAAPMFLTGDKNLVNLRLTVQYRVDESGVRDFLYGSVSREDRLSCLAQAAATELLAESGVDYVQVSGQANWRKELADRLQEKAKRRGLGVVIEEVMLDEISPPVQVKADFLDVANARAQREQIIQAALSTAEGHRERAKAKAREIRDAAESQAREEDQAAKGSAARFLEIIGPFRKAPESPQAPNRTLARRLAMERYYHQTLAEILNRVKGQVFLDTGQPVDLTIMKMLNANDRGAPKADTEESP